MDVDKFAGSPLGALVPISGMDGRFNRPFEHFAFVAAPLDREPVLEPTTWHAVTAASRALARLDQASRLVPNPRTFLRPTLRREAQSTSALEGTFAPLEQVLASDATDEASRSKELREVLNYVEAATLAYDAIENGRPLNAGLIETVHAILVRGTDADTDQAGRVRTTQVAIGSSTGAIEDARFVPMPAGTQLNVAVQDLTRWMSSPPADRDPIVAAAMAHYQFETLHPFNDGNGRIGRLMVILQFMVDGLIGEPLLSVSPWFEARRTEYQDHLAAVSATGVWDEWIRFFAHGVASSADDVALRVDRMLAVRARYVQILQDENARGVIRDIVDALVADQIITVSMMCERFGKTPPAVSQALQKLVEYDILTGPFGTYGRQYIAEDLFVAVTAPVGRVPSRDAPIKRDRR
ncbi:Fic family protein [Microbacterium mcarthurae (nom. nud.)]|uniref:Fic/DOC family N-terminal domain-containing protein n=1 Tax=Microbacterium mcarthurae TaxID=3035918 RepID=A0ABW9GH20_9MICO